MSSRAKTLQNQISRYQSVKSFEQIKSRKVAVELDKLVSQKKKLQEKRDQLMYQRTEVLNRFRVEYQASLGVTVSEDYREYLMLLEREMSQVSVSIQQNQTQQKDLQALLATNLKKIRVVEDLEVSSVNELHKERDENQLKEVVDQFNSRERYTNG